MILKKSQISHAQVVWRDNQQIVIGLPDYAELDNLLEKSNNS